VGYPHRFCIAGVVVGVVVVGVVVVVVVLVLVLVCADDSEGQLVPSKVAEVASTESNHGGKQR